VRACGGGGGERGGSKDWTHHVHHGPAIPASVLDLVEELHDKRMTVPSQQVVVAVLKGFT
jgi:hypothetical protein